MKHVCALASALLMLAASGGVGAQEVSGPVSHTEVFVAGEGGYHTYRIPSLIVTAKGTVLAFAEGRKSGAADSGDIDLVLRRSADGGASWSGLQVLVDNGPNSASNPCPVIDRNTGTIWAQAIRPAAKPNEGWVINAGFGENDKPTIENEDINLAIKAKLDPLNRLNPGRLF